MKKVGYIAVSDSDRDTYLRESFESFKGEMTDKKAMFPKDLGVEHPFDFEQIERIYCKMGLVNGGVDKYVDSIVGEFSIKSTNPNADALIKSFIKDTNFAIELRAWIREAIMKGNGFMELDLKNNQIRVLNANNMYVLRDSHGKVLGYNQWVGDLKRFSTTSRKLIHFETNEIAHLKINHVADRAYGIGYIYPSMKAIDYLAGNTEDVHKLIKRKAGAPIHVQVGAEGEMVNTADIDEFKANLQFMNNQTEWVTDGSTKINVLNFGEVGKNLTVQIDNDIMMILYGMQIPAVEMGMANIAEGLAKSQKETLQRKIASMQEEIESVIEEKILKPYLKANKLGAPVEFLWNLPGEEEINNRIDKITNLLKIGSTIDENMRRMLQLELAKALNIEEYDKVLMQPEAGVDEENQEMEKKNKEAELEAKIPQPEVPGAKPNAKESIGIDTHIHEQHMHGIGCGQQLTDDEVGNMTVQEWANVRELRNFNYSDYTIMVLKALRKYKFTDLKAITEQDIIDGLLPPQDIEKLRIILKNAFKENKSMRWIEKEIKDNIPLRDRMTAGKITSIAARRPSNIARTETIRISNIGLVEHYKENNIGQVRFLAALSERTCPECEALNGTIYKINELSIGTSQPPIHPSCRCSLIPVVD